MAPHSHLLALLLVLGSASTARAQDPDDEWGDSEAEFGELDTEAAVESLKIDIAGRIGVEHFTYFETLDGKNNGRDEVELALSLRAGTDEVSGFGTFLMRHDFADRSRQRVDAEEAYLDVRIGDFAFRAGKVIEGWGAASLYNPTDVLNPRDLRDLLDRETLGTWMARASYIIGPVRLDAYYLPVHEPDLLPDIEGFDALGRPISRSRWILDRPVPSIGVPVVTTVDRQDDFQPTGDNAQVAGRIALKTDSFDASVGYGYLFDRLPTTRRTTNPGVGQLDVLLTVTYERVHVATFDFETTFGKLRIAGEALAWLTDDFDSADPDLEDPQITAVLGGDYRAGPFGEDHHVHFFLEGLVARSLVGDEEQVSSELRRPLDLAALARIEYTWGEELKVQLTVASALETFDMVVHPAIEYRYRGLLTARLELEWLTGDTERAGFFARYRDNTRVEVSLGAKF